jgi:hypothetical protein
VSAQRGRLDSPERKSSWPTCPYCGALIPKSRRRATKCRACGETYYVRGTQTLFMTRALRLEQLAFVELVKTISVFGIDTRAVAAAAAPAMNADELLIVILEACDRAAIQVGEDAYSIYYAIARFLFAAGRDPRKALRLGATAELRTMREQGMTHVLLLRAPDSDHCETCRQADGRLLSIDSAETLLPIPCPECTVRAGEGTWGWCTCRYAIAPATPRRSTPPNAGVEIPANDRIG